MRTEANARSPLRVVGFLFQHRLFSAPLPPEVARLAEAGTRTFSVGGPQLPWELQQFQEVLDVALGALPRVDWGRCASGAARMELLIKQVWAAAGLRSSETGRVPEPSDPEEVFMDLPHSDVYYPGADYFVASDGPWRTLFYPHGPHKRPMTFPSRAVVHYDAVSMHSAPGFCAASTYEPSSLRGPKVLRTFVRLLAWDPSWSLQRFPHFAAQLTTGPPIDWRRAGVCEAEDVIHACFDAVHTCERCCDLRRGALGDNLCWAGWMTYEKCCGPASRRWGGCGWRMGVDLWAHDYFSLQPPRLHSAAQCQQRCSEEPQCGGWTHFPSSWQPERCRLPLAAIISLRRVCLLRADVEGDPTPHHGMLWGPRDCEHDGGCLKVGVDRTAADLAYHQQVTDVAACRRLCQGHSACSAFAYFPDDYAGDASDTCKLPLAVVDAWRSRCLLKTAAMAGDDVAQWLPQLGNIVSGSRSCGASLPWDSSIQADAVAAAGDTADALDGNYTLAGCAVRKPWRAELDAAYLVVKVALWTGEREGIFFRERREYAVHLIAEGGNQEPVRCGSISEMAATGPQAVDCPPVPSRVVVVTVEDPSMGFSLCEVEVQVQAVPCSQLVHQWVVINSFSVGMFAPGSVLPVDPSLVKGDTCQRHGGALVSFAAGAPICIEAACAPSACLLAFDQDPQAFLQHTGAGLFSPALLAAAEGCRAHAGQLHEASVLAAGGTLHSTFCVPAACDEDTAGAVVLRQVEALHLAQRALASPFATEVRGVRPLARWEDVALDFLLAGFPRSGTHSLLGNLARHPGVAVAGRELTFNWGQLPLRGQVQEVARSFSADDGAVPRRLLGGKGEGVALSPRLLRSLAAVPGLRLVLIVREPAEWLESLYNLRAHGCRSEPGRCQAGVPSLDDVVQRGATFEDVNVEASLADGVEAAVRHFPPREGRLLLLEFELLRLRPRELYDRLCRFLGLAPFPPNFSFSILGTGDRSQYEGQGLRSTLCSPEHKQSMSVLRQRLAERGEHARLARLLATSGSEWVSSRLVLNRTHCD